jgi:hypothetical protein
MATPYDKHEQRRSAQRSPSALRSVQGAVTAQLSPTMRSCDTRLCCLVSQPIMAGVVNNASSARDVDSLGKRFPAGFNMCLDRPVVLWSEARQRKNQRKA